MLGSIMPQLHGTNREIVQVIQLIVVSLISSHRPSCQPGSKLSKQQPWPQSPPRSTCWSQTPCEAYAHGDQLQIQDAPGACRATFRGEGTRRGLHQPTWH